MRACMSVCMLHVCMHVCNEAEEVMGLDHTELGKEFGFYLESDEEL